MKLYTSIYRLSFKLSRPLGRALAVAFAALFVNHPVYAVIARVKPDSISAVPTGSLVQVTLGLFVVLVAIVIGAWLVKRLGHFPSTPDSDLKVIGGLSMGPRERVVLIQVGKEQVLLGVAPGRIQKIHVLAEPVEQATVNRVGNTGFAGRFKDALAQQFGGKSSSFKSTNMVGEKIR